MVRINLLPHREAKRKKQKEAFLALMLLSAILGAAVVLVVGAFNAHRLSVQDERNRLIATANAALDKKIVEIATLKQEIEALKARQQAVEDLQGDRNQPVYLLDELVKQTPDGVYLKAFTQEGQRVSMSGYAQSQERVSQFLRNLAGNSPWLERPDLIEVRAFALDKSKGARKAVEFTIVVNIKRPRDRDSADLAAPASARQAAKLEHPKAQRTRLEYAGSEHARSERTT
jgi:type IV pilus assembly protein PilN